MRWYILGHIWEIKCQQIKDCHSTGAITVDQFTSNLDKDGMLSRYWWQTSGKTSLLVVKVPEYLVSLPKRPPCLPCLHPYLLLWSRWSCSPSSPSCPWPSLPPRPLGPSMVNYSLIACSISASFITETFLSQKSYHSISSHTAASIPKSPNLSNIEARKTF